MSNELRKHLENCRKPVGGDPKIQIMGRVWHLLDGNVSAVLNSVGRELPDDTPLVSLDDHRAKLAPLQAELARLSAESEWRGKMAESNCAEHDKMVAVAHDLRAELDQLKARRDELEGLLRECRPALDQAAGGVFKEHRVIRDNVKAAMSKPAGSDQ